MTHPLARLTRRQSRSRTGRRLLRGARSLTNYLAEGVADAVRNFVISDILLPALTSQLWPFVLDAVAALLLS